MSVAVPAITETTRPPRRERWIPLSLRMFVTMLVLLFVGSALWVGVPAYRQHVALGKIKTLGGQCSFERTAPQWLRDLVGNEVVRPLDAVELIEFSPDDATFRRRFGCGIYTGPIFRSSGPTVGDATVACVTAFRSTKRLDLRWTDIGDAGMTHVSRLLVLTELDLEGTDVSDRSAPILAQLTNLRRLNIGHSKITDLGFVHLKALTNLETLAADGNQLTNAGIQHLTELPHLECLEVHVCDRDRPGLLEHLRGTLKSVRFP
jgi:internalin A